MTTLVNERMGPIHNSHLTAIRRCKRKFKYSFIDGIQPKMPSLPLTRGIWIHYCLQAQFLKWGIEDGTLLEVPETIKVDGIGEVALVIDESTKEAYLVVGDIEDATGETRSYTLNAAGMLKLLTEHAWADLFPQEHEKYTEDDHTLPEAVKRILTEYFFFYKDKFENRTFKILLVEAEWQREYKGVEFEGRVDYVIQEENGLIVCGDWKSTKREPHPEYKFMESQLHLYPWGLAPQLEKAGLDSKLVDNMAVEFDYLSTKLPTTPSQNQDGSISKRKINTTYLTLKTALEDYGIKWKKNQILEFLDKNEKEFFLNKRLPRNKRVVKSVLDEALADAKGIEGVLEDPSLITRSVTYNCSFDCDFLDLCKAERYGQSISTMLKRDYEPRTNTHAGVVDKDD